MYASFIATSIYLGYAIGINPIVGYHYGADNKSELHNLLTKSLRITGVTALSITLLSELLALPIARLFVGYDLVLCKMTRTGFMLYAISYLFSGFNIFGSAFFTGLNNGKNFCDHFHPTYFGDPDTRTADPPDIFRSQRYLVCNYGSRISHADRNWLFPASGKEKSIIIKLSYYQLSRKRVLHRFLFPVPASEYRLLHTGRSWHVS